MCRRDKYIKIKVIFMIFIVEVRNLIFVGFGGSNR